MPRWLLWIRFLAVALGYVLAFVVARAWAPFRIDSPWFVITAMICVLGLAAMLRPLLRLRMPAALRSVREWEEHGPAVRWFGVRRFGRALRRTPLRLLNTDVYSRAGETDPARLLRELEAAETSHVWSTVLCVPYLVAGAAWGQWWGVAGVAVALIPVNLLPIMHLRLTRARIERLSRARAGVSWREPATKRSEPS